MSFSGCTSSLPPPTVLPSSLLFSIAVSPPHLRHLEGGMTVVTLSVNKCI